MSLLVAAISGSTVWMVSDTAITGGTIDLRRREYLPKIEPSKARNELVGFAGDPDLGARLVRSAAKEETPSKAIKILVDGSRNSHVEFSYAYFEATGPMLLRIENGNVESIQALYLGVHAAFEDLQRIRLGEINPYAPLAFKNFMCGARVDVPERLSETIRCMIDLFASREERDVGGWPVPYLLSKNEAFFCGYCYGVSDPLFDKLTPGSVIPHGTPAQGGSTLSVTEVGNAEGMVVYWLQIPGGTVLMRNEEGYDLKVITGGPSSFKQTAQGYLGRPIDLWIGDQPAGAVKALTIMRDTNGNINAVIADHGDSLTFAVHNMATPFHSRAEIAMATAESSVNEKISVTVSPNKDSVKLKSVSAVGNPEEITLDAKELDRLIFQLGQARSELLDQVPADLPQGAKMAAQFNPRWYTHQSPHPSLQGILLNLRHSGLGWLGFILPHNEALALGKWLHDNSAKVQDGELEQNTPR